MRWLLAGFVAACLVTGAAEAVQAAPIAHAAAAPAAPIPTNAGDNGRDGWYPDEPGLSPATVQSGSFGELFSKQLNGDIYAQPIVSNGVLLVVTETDNIYGLSPATGAQIWTKNVGSPLPASALPCSDLSPNIGITGTPVVDSATGTAYVMAKTWDGAKATWKLHALDIHTGAERSGWPVTIAGNADNHPSVPFSPKTQLQRPGLLLLNGVVYAGFGSHCDISPYQGWVFGVSTTNHAITAKWVDTSGLDGAGIWQAGGGLISDGSNQLIVATGNAFGVNYGTSPVLGSHAPADLGEAVVRLTVQSNGQLKPTDFYIPADAAQLDSWDADLTSGAPIALPKQYFGTTAHSRLLTIIGKQGYLVTLDRDSLGGYRNGPSLSDKVVQKIGRYGGVWSRPAAWPGGGGYLWVPTSTGGGNIAGGAGHSGKLMAFKYAVDGNGNPGFTAPVESPDAFGAYSGAPIITSDGTDDGSGVVWIEWAANNLGQQAQLRAYKAIPSGGQLVQLGVWPIGNSTNFSSPGVSGNRIYVGTRGGQIKGFGYPVDQPFSYVGTDLGTTTVGTTVTKNITITAAYDLTLGAVSTTSVFTAGSPSRTTVPAGETATIPVTFAPTVPGAAGGTVVVATNKGTETIPVSGFGRWAGPHLTLSANAISFGGIVAGSSKSDSFALTNDGAQPLVVSSSTLSPSGQPFTLSGLPANGTSIAPGASVSVQVTFAPTQDGSYSAQLTFATNSGQPEQEQQIGFTGQAAAAPKLTINPSALSYGTVPIGQSSRKTFTLTNTGGTDLIITRSKPPITDGFSAVTQVPEGTTLTPGQSMTVSVQFKPTSLGAKTSSWQLNAEDGGGIRTVTFTGQGGSPVFSAQWLVNGTQCLQSTWPASHTVGAGGCAYVAGQAWSLNSAGHLVDGRSRACAAQSSGKVAVTTCNSTTAQKWTYNPATGHLVNGASSQCLTRTNSAISMTTCGTASSQKWSVKIPVSPHPISAKALVNRAWQRCLDAAASSHIADCAAVKSQIWTLDPFQRMRVASTGACLTPGSGGTVTVASCTGSGTQLWTFLSTGGLRNDSTGECLKAPGATKADNDPLVLASCTSDLRRLWRTA